MKILRPDRWVAAYRILTEDQIMVVTYRGILVSTKKNNYDEFIAYCRKMISKTFALRSKGE